MIPRPAPHHPHHLRLHIRRRSPEQQVSKIIVSSLILVLLLLCPRNIEKCDTSSYGRSGIGSKDPPAGLQKGDVSGEGGFVEVWDASQFWIQSLSSGRLLSVEGGRARTTDAVPGSRRDLKVTWQRQIVIPGPDIFGFPPRPRSFQVRLFHPGSGNFLCVPNSTGADDSNLGKPIIEVLALPPQAMRLGELQGRVTCHLSERISPRDPTFLTYSFDSSPFPRQLAVCRGRNRMSNKLTAVAISARKRKCDTRFAKGPRFPASPFPPSWMGD